MTTAEDIIKQFNMVRHQEGGYYVQTHRSNQAVMIEKDGETIKRDASSTIIFMLVGDDVSTWHKIDADEQWSFCGGSPLKLYYIDDHGQLITTLMGNPLEHTNAVPVSTVPRNHWYAAEVVDKNSLSIVTGVVSPGFEYDGGFELGTRDELLKQYPHLAVIITRLTNEVTVQPAVGTEPHTSDSAINN